MKKGLDNAGVHRPNRERGGGQPNVCAAEGKETWPPGLGRPTGQEKDGIKPIRLDLGDDITKEGPRWVEPDNLLQSIKHEPI